MVNKAFTTSALVALVVLSGGGAAAARGVAGAEVRNTATLAYTDSVGAHTATSNTVSLRILQVVDAALDVVGAERPPATPGACLLTFRLGNPGNGAQAYRLGFAATGFTPGSARLTVAGASAAYTPGATDPVLAPGAFVLLTVAGDAPDAPCAAKVTATADAGHGAPGLVLPAAGPGGVDGLVGATGGQVDARASVPLAPSGAGGGAGAIDVTLTKTQSVRDPAGGARVIAGSVVTYTLTARAGSAADDLVLTDPIPAGAAYVPGSLQLDASPLSDAGRADGAGVRVALGDVAAAGQHVVTFQVRILQSGA